MAMQPIVSPGSQTQPVQQTQQAQDVQMSVTPKVEQIQKEPFQPLESPEGAKAISEDAVKKQIQNLNDLLKARNTNVTLEYDHFSSPSRVNIIDSDSGKVINQIPPKAVVDIASKAKDFIIGLMVDHKA